MSVSLSERPIAALMAIGLLTQSPEEVLRRSDVGAFAPTSFRARIALTRPPQNVPHEVEIWRSGDLKVKGDYVVAMIACTSEAEMVLSVTEGGFGKRTSVEEYRAQGRGGKGIINVRTTDKNGKVVAIMRVNEDSDVLVMTANGKLKRDAIATRFAEEFEGLDGLRLGDGKVRKREEK